MAVASVAVIGSQYRAALSMLEAVVDRCPDDLWTASSRLRPFWQIAFHILFYTHFYTHPSDSEFEQWDKQRDESQYLGPLRWPPDRAPIIGEPYTKAEILEFLNVCRDTLAARLPATDLTSTVSGFSWLPFGKLELQLYNIRHIQQHTGELSQRLGDDGIEVPWIGKMDV